MIKQINLVNCQSLGNVTYDLASDKLNVIVADNNVGKSVLFKMIKLFASSKVYTPAERKELIRWGAEYALISITLDTDEVYSVAVFPTSVMYVYQQNADSDLENREGFTFEELRHIGLLANDSFIANVLDSDQDMALVTSNQRTNYDLMQLLLHDDVIENLQSRLTAQTSQCGLFESNLVEKRVEVNSLLSANQFQNLEGLRAAQSYLQVSTNFTEKLVNLATILDSFIFTGEFTPNEEAFSLLDKLTLPAISVVTPVSADEHFSLLNKLTLPSISTVTLVRAEESFSLLAKLTLPVIEDATRHEEEAQSILRQLEEFSTILECPVHGKVVALHDKCLYLDN